MKRDLSTSHSGTGRQPRSKGKLIGAKPTLRLKHIWATPSWRGASGIRRCSTSPSTESCAVAIW